MIRCSRESFLALKSVVATVTFALPSPPRQGWRPDVVTADQAAYLETRSRIWGLKVALSIKTDEADRLARTLASLTGETLTEAITAALRERLARERAKRDATDLPARVADF